MGLEPRIRFDPNGPWHDLAALIIALLLLAIYLYCH